MIDLVCTGVHVQKDGTDTCAIVHKPVFLEQRVEIVSKNVVCILSIMSIKQNLSLKQLLQISVAFALFGSRNLCAKAILKSAFWLTTIYID